MFVIFCLSVFVFLFIYKKESFFDLPCSNAMPLREPKHGFPFIPMLFQR